MSASIIEFLPTAHRVAEANQAVAVNVPRATILIVDGDPASAGSLVNRLNQQGYAVRLTSSGLQALVSMRVNRPDLVLLEISIADLNGYALCEQVKADTELNDIPVVFFSTVTDTASKIRAFVVGAVDYLNRPLPFDELLVRLEHHLRLAQERRTLQQCEARYRSIVESQAEMIVRYQPDYTLTFVNRSFSQIVGCPREELVGQSVLSFFPEKVQQVMQQFAAEAHPEHMLTCFEYRMYDAQQRLRLTEWTIRALFNGHGGITEFQVIGYDMTWQRQMEEGLRNSEERFRQLAEHARDILFRYRFTEPRGFEYVSPSVHHIMGFTPEEYYADPEIDLKQLHPDSDVVFTVSGQSPYLLKEQITMRCLTKDGHEVWLEQSHYPVRDTQGMIIAVEGIARDITERKRAEDAMRSNLQLLQTLLDTIPNPVFYKDVQGHYLGWNNLFAQQILGLNDDLTAAEEQHSASLESLDSTMTEPDATHNLEVQLMQGSDAPLYVSKVQCADGVTRDFYFSRASFADAEGDVAGMVYVMVDITDRIEKEMQLRDAYNDVQRLNDRLHAELTIAEQIQQSLLPESTPDWPDLDLVCYTRPAREVGGDWYAYYTLKIPDTEGSSTMYSVALGDASGKGMPAALLMAVSLASFRSIVGQGLPPSDLLAYLNDALIDYTRTIRQNCALVYADIQHTTSIDAHGQTTHQYCLRVANAGCIVPIVKHADGRAEWIDVGGLPLGVELGLDVGYHEVSWSLSPGELVILTSDGVVELTNADGHMFGFDQLEQTVRTGPQGNAEAMLQHLRASIAAFGDEREPHDDLTIVVIGVPYL
ncbi:MAG: PAS domain S-box protein [Chloroflexaceae bacterium]|nr:PAS domain S-box protein [Chloroflexaceae bacterium]